jgi:hypothetical protein
VLSRPGQQQFGGHHPGQTAAGVAALAGTAIYTSHCNRSSQRLASAHHSGLLERLGSGARRDTLFWAAHSLLGVALS